MASDGLNPRDWRDIQILRAQGVLAELLAVSPAEADRGLRAHAEATGTSLHDVAAQVCARELILDRDLCVTAGPPSEPSTSIAPRPGRGPRADMETGTEHLARQARDGRVRRREQAELIGRAENAIELIRKSYLRLADTADVLAETYEQLATTREALARSTGSADGPERARLTRARAIAERREAQRYRHAAEAPLETD